MLTIATENDTFQVEVNPEMTVEDLKACFEADVSIDSGDLDFPSRSLVDVDSGGDKIDISKLTFHLKF